MRLGIDFGTTRTVVAAADGGRYPVAAFDTGDAYAEYVPGLAALAGGAWHYGWDAVAVLDRAEAAVRSIKRLVGRAAPDEIVTAGSAPLTALELATGFLTALRRALDERSNLDLDVAPGAPVPAYVAVPANASSRQRYLTLEAFGRAGFAVDGLLNEPTAASVEFAQRNLAALSARSPKRYVVVYDLGGGTFDTSAVSLAGRRFELLTTEGIARLGGDDFDEVLAGLALEAAGLTVADLDSTQRAALLERCREAKESLRPTSRKLLVDLGAVVPGAAEVVLEATAFYERCAPLVERTLDLLGDVFARLPSFGIDPENPRELGGVYLVGGAVELPAVARALRAIYKRKIERAPQPHAATAVGLAICADADAGVFVHEATTRHFGVWREASGGRDKVFDPILAKDTTPAGGGPIVVHRTYRPTHTIGCLRFLECASLDATGQPAGDLTPWARIEFPYDPALAERGDLSGVPVERADLGGEEIAETYTYDRDGTIAVDIENRTRGYRRRYVLGHMA